MQAASLDDSGSGLDADTLYRLRNPLTQPASFEGDRALEAAIKLYIGLNHADSDYNVARETLMNFTQLDEFPSYYQAKMKTTELSGVEPVVLDMCINSCIGFTGPFHHLSHCSECGESRYDTTLLQDTQGVVRKPCKQFSTILLGPQLQALYRDPQKANDMNYRREYTHRVFDKLRQNGGIQDVYNDFFDGSDYLKAVQAGKIKDDDIVLMTSIDGAQLYRNKQSDCWMSIWVIFDHSPDIQYRKKYVLPGVVIPGPNKPKNLDSFMFPSYHHIAALQHEGLCIWNACTNRSYLANLFIALGTADGPGLAYLNGLVGHHGKNGCRLYCGLQGRHNEGAPHYYPALKKPLDFDVRGSNHPDVDPSDFAACSLMTYWRNLTYVLLSPNETQYKKRRLETSISKPSIFLGFQVNSTFGIPKCFSSDIMHLLSLNIPDLLIPLWRGTFDCQPGDNKATWDWAALSNPAVWKRHGAQVADVTVDIPGVFGRPPRNPAEKISSGYKAWEYHLYLYGLAPGLLRDILPHPYWRHFCKLVRAVRLISQHSITRNELKLAHNLFMEFVVEFEDLYYQRKPERLHFVCQSLHALTHYAHEVETKGPLICASQWTMERTIGNLTEEIRLHSDPFANLTKRAVRRARINALKAMIPSLDQDKDKPHIPRWLQDIGGGYYLLPQHERSRHPTTFQETWALLDYFQQHAPNSPSLKFLSSDGRIKVLRWARLLLPNGQKCRSLWCRRESKPNARKSRNIKVRVIVISLF